MKSPYVLGFVYGLCIALLKKYTDFWIYQIQENLKSFEEPAFGDWMVHGSWASRAASTI